MTTICDSALIYSTKLESIVIPASVTEIGNSVFSVSNPDLIVLCMVESKPEGWHQYWSDGVSNIFWNYNDTKSYTYTFDLGAGIPVEPITTTGYITVPIPTTLDPEKTIFDGWYTSSNFEISSKILLFYNRYNTLC